jgi:hypothetical protein
MIRTRYVALAAIFGFLAAVAASEKEHNPSYLSASILAALAILFILIGYLERRGR